MYDPQSSPEEVKEKEEKAEEGNEENEEGEEEDNQKQSGEKDEFEEDLVRQILLHMYLQPSSLSYLIVAGTLTRIWLHTTYPVVHVHVHVCT